MATELQKRAVDKLVEMGRQPRSLGKAMIAAGYDPTTALHPKKLTESKGFKEICKKNGLTENLITKALVSDIKSKPKKRLGELNLGAEILRIKKQDAKGDTKVQIVNINYIVPNGHNAPAVETKNLTNVES